jgi:hypothetical protein
VLDDLEKEWGDSQPQRAIKVAAGGFPVAAGCHRTIELTRQHIRPFKPSGDYPSTNAELTPPRFRRTLASTLASNMGNKKLHRATVQASNVTFELHTLGWEAFQNLCGHVAREILGQTATIFSPSNDAGQDGAFQGVWKRLKNETFEGRFVIQCKFTTQRDEHLSLGALKDELVKAEKLAQNGLAQTYLLITNAKVSGGSDKTIREAFLKIKGINFFDLFGSEWLTQQIKP